jgi:hypothetical protein
MLGVTMVPYYIVNSGLCTFRDVSGETVAKVALRHVETGSKIYTDNFPPYNILQRMGVQA